MPIISAETPDVEKSITAKEEKADSTLNGFECETPVIDPSSGTDYELSTKMPEMMTIKLNRRRICLELILL